MLPVILFISKCLKYQIQLTKCSHQVRTAPLLLCYLSVSNIVIVGITLKFYGNLHYVIFIFDFICEKAFFLPSPCSSSCFQSLGSSITEISSHLSRSACSVHVCPLPSISSLIWSCHLVLGLQIYLIPLGFVCSIFFGICSADMRIACPYHFKVYAIRREH